MGGDLLATEADIRGGGPAGAINLVGARVGGRLALPGAQVWNESGPAVVADNLRVTDTANFSSGFVARGSGERGAVRLVGARIGASLSFGGSEVHNPDGTAVRAHYLDVDGSCYFDRMTATGGIRVAGGRIGGRLDLTAARITAAASEPAVDGGRIRVGQGVRCPDATLTGGDERAACLSLRAAQIDGDLDLSGARLAAAYQAAGHEDEARRVLIAQQLHLRDSGLLTGWSRLRHRAFGLTLGYGYQSWRAIVGLLAALLAAVVLLVAVPGGSTRPPSAAAPGTPCVAVERVGLAIDLTVPLLNSGARDRCDVATSTRSGAAVLATTWLLQLAGWAFATLLVAGYSGLVRRG